MLSDDNFDDTEDSEVCSHKKSDGYDLSDAAKQIHPMVQQVFKDNFSEESSKVVPKIELMVGSSTFSAVVPLDNISFLIGSHLKGQITKR